MNHAKYCVIKGFRKWGCHVIRMSKKVKNPRGNDPEFCKLLYIFAVRDLFKAAVELD